jgi:magnesium-transporting ATPase (P-type)
MFGMLVQLPNTPITGIQILYSNFICAVTLGFVTAIEPAEEGIMTVPPRRVGKRLIGRYLLLRIAIGTIMLTGAVVSSAKIVETAPRYAYLLAPDMIDCSTLKGVTTCVPTELMYKIRATAFNVLDFGAISIMMSARFSYLSSAHPRVFVGNNAALASCAIVSVLQIFFTYCPGINTVIFQMKAMDGFGWMLTVVWMVAIFIVMEVEKAIRRSLRAKGADTDDKEIGAFDAEVVPPGSEHMNLPKGASKLNLQELTK